MTIAVTVQRVNILGVQLHNVRRTDVLNYGTQMIDDGDPHIITTPNVDYVVQAQQDRALFEILNASALTLSDGMGIVYASRLLGTPLLMNVGGRLTAPALCGLAAERGYRVFLFGARPGVAQRAAEQLKHDYPGLE